MGARLPMDQRSAFRYGAIKHNLSVRKDSTSKACRLTTLNPSVKAAKLQLIQSAAEFVATTGVVIRHGAQQTGTATCSLSSGRRLSWAEDDVRETTDHPLRAAEARSHR